MKKVLIALDYDPTAQKVAEKGFALAKAMASEVVLMHVISDPVYYSSTAYSPIMGFGGFVELDFLQPDILDNLERASQDFLDRSKHHLGDEAIQTRTGEGDVADALLKAATDVQADVIVMGSHSQKWLETIVMGSVTKKVLQNTFIPVFIIPTKKPNWFFRP